MIEIKKESRWCACRRMSLSTIRGVLIGSFGRSEAFSADGSEPAGGVAPIDSLSTQCMYMTQRRCYIFKLQ